MKQFLRSISPRRAVKDFAGHWEQPTPHRWPILGVACAATFAVFMLFLPDSIPVAPKEPDLIYITTFDGNRTREDIIASNCANQELQDSIRARLEERAELRRDIYRALGEATFVDVAAMEAEVAEQRRAKREAAGLGEELSEDELQLSIAEYCTQAVSGA